MFSMLCVLQRLFFIDFQGGFVTYSIGCFKALSKEGSCMKINVITFTPSIFPFSETFPIFTIISGNPEHRLVFLTRPVRM